MTLLLYEKGNDTPSIYADGNTNRTDKYKKGWFMAYKQGGIWEITVRGDLKDYYYNFQVDNYQGSTTTVDPYVTAVGCSGVRGLVYDKKDANPTGWDDVPTVWDGVEEYDITTPQQLSIYEVHVRDFTGDSSWKSNEGNKNGTYKAFVESGTRLANHNTVTTGYDHLMDLGINTVQLMPVFDADNDESMERGGLEKYNWGYNPQNYNAVEGAYSSDPHDALARIKEYKELIMGLANPGAGKKHVRVTMDVVYNHVSSVSAHPFTKLMPKYYFRYDENGELYNGSGCHNEVRSEAKMCRKFIIDSVYMWAKEYKIKGFRFDLMGLIDYQTMNLLKERLSLLDRDVYLYGEGWSAEGYHGSNYMNWGTETWQVYNRCNNFREIDGYDDDSLCYLGAFNNTGRNGVKGDNGGGQPCYPETGFMQKSFDGDMGDFNARVVDMCWGIHRGVSNYAKQTVNYISCHDNWTVVDQLWQTMNQEVGDEDARKNTPGNIGEIAHASLAAHALVFASNGVAFMLGGEEIFRTKEVSQSMIDQKKVLVDTYSPMYGRYVSHNSYNSPIEVNSFKWGNKVSVTLGGATITDSELQYNDAWKTLTHLHEKETFVSPSRYDEMWPGNKTSDEKPIENLWWRIDSSGMGIQVDETFIFVNGRFSSGSSFSLPEGSTVKFKYGAYEVDSWNPHFGGFGVIVCQRG
jgi:pullulanase